MSIFKSASDGTHLPYSRIASKLSQSGAAAVDDGKDVIWSHNTHLRVGCVQRIIEVHGTQFLGEGKILGHHVLKKKRVNMVIKCYRRAYITMESGSTTTNSS